MDTRPLQVREKGTIATAECTLTALKNHAILPMAAFSEAAPSGGRAPANDRPKELHLHLRST